MWWGGGPCDFSVSPSPFGLDFGTLDFGTSDLGLTIVLHFGANVDSFCVKCTGFVKATATIVDTLKMQK